MEPSQHARTRNRLRPPAARRREGITRQCDCGGMVLGSRCSLCGTSLSAQDWYEILPGFEVTATWLAGFTQAGSSERRG